MSPRRIAALVLAAVTVPAGPLPGQEWRLDARGGRYQLERGPVGSASSGAVLGLRYLDGRSWLGVFAGPPLGEESAAWGAAATALRLTRDGGALRVGVHLAGQASLQGDRNDGSADGDRNGPPLPDLPLGPGRLPGSGTEPSLSGWGASVEVAPLVAWDRGPLRVEARGGGAHYHSDFRDQAFDRQVGLAHLQLSLRPDPRLALSVGGSGYWAEEGTYPYVGAGAAAAGRRLGVRASVGAWLRDDVPTTPWSLGASMELSDRVSVEASVRRDAFDPLFVTPARTSWSLGASVALSGADRPAAPVPAVYEDGEATILLPAEEAGQAPRVAGDFNDWRPEPMVRQDDHWAFRVGLDPGVYYYAFVSPDGTWYVPESVPGRKGDGFGGHTAVLVVR